MNAATFKTTENGYMADKNERQGRMKNPLQKTVSQVLLIFYNSINDKNHV
jgi:hypothetical protein